MKKKKASKQLLRCLVLNLRGNYWAQCIIINIEIKILKADIIIKWKIVEMKKIYIILFK